MKATSKRALETRKTNICAKAASYLSSTEQVLDTLLEGKAGRVLHCQVAVSNTY
jgi:hypothetical protein